MNQSVCLNPACAARNECDHNFCYKCGQPLTLVNRYKAIEELGRGSFGRTFKAIDLHLPSQPLCVIKQFSPQSNDQDIIQKASEMFLEEAKRLDELGKYNDQIPSLMAHFAIKQQQYLVQEFIDGKNLAEAIHLNIFSEKAVKQVLFDMLRVLNFLHDRKFIHRDIKPENIIYRQADQKLFLVDFGTVKHLPDQLQQVVGATVVGTEVYMAPEQARGQATYASDLYSLGVTCLVLLTGKSPFDLFDVEENKWSWRQYLPSQTINEHLGAVLDQLTEPATKYRYQTVSDVVQDLKKRFLASETSANSSASVPAMAVNANSVRSPVSISANATTTIPTQQPLTITALPKPALTPFYPSRYVQNLGRGVTLDMVLISAGEFMMGNDDPDYRLIKEEHPSHQVAIAEPFYLGKFVVTQAQWQVIIGDKPSWFGKAIFGKRRYPVERVSWHDCHKFLKRLNLKTHRQYRLPSEAEWEYACRAGSDTPYSFNYQRLLLEDYAWYADNTSMETRPVGKKKANPWGLFDMHGNVWEWCEDDWEHHYQTPRTQTPHRCAAQEKVIRGGAWVEKPEQCRSASRQGRSPHDHINYIGFRIALSAKDFGANA